MIEPISKNIDLGGQITPAALNAAGEIFQEEGGTYSGFAVAMETLGRDWNHPRYGKLTKRLAKYAKRHLSLDLSEKALSKMGKIMGESAMTKHLHVSILPNTCFTPGIFGDDDACFFKPNYTHYRQSIEELNGKGVCFFENKEPLARCWLIENPAEENFICFNLYVAYKMSFSLRQAAEAMLQVLNLAYCKEMYWRTDNIYVNNNKVFVLSNIKPSQTTYSLDQPEVCDSVTSCRGCGQIVDTGTTTCNFCGDSIGLACCDCGNHVNEEYANFVDSNCYCENCFNEYFTYCEECDATISREDAYYVEGYGSYCRDCYEHTFTRCDCCEEDVIIDNTYIAYNRRGDQVEVCESCIDNNYYVRCEKCDEYHHTDNINSLDDIAMCQDCYDEYVVTCSSCGDEAWKESAIKRDNGYYYCENCNEEIEEEEKEREAA